MIILIIIIVILQYGNMANQCSGCMVEIKTLQRRHNCTVCGVLVCTQCSSQDLIVYIPDEDDAELTAKLAIINILGV